MLKRNGSKCTLSFSDGSEKTITIENKTLLNKLDITISDINAVFQDLEPVYQKFFKIIEDETYSEIYIKNLVSPAKKLVALRTTPELISSFCNSSKKTKTSIYFDEKDMTELLELISVLKFLSVFIHSEHKNLFNTVLEKVAKHYKTISEKLFNIIKTRTYSFSRQDLELVKYMLSMNFLVLYNYEFILLSVVPHYNWKKNPLSFIVATAGENSNFLFLTYRAQTTTYSSDELDSSSNILETVSYELILNTISKNRYSNYGYITPITTYFALPLLYKLSDIPLSYLMNKPTEEKLAMQRFLFELSKKSEMFRKLLRESAKLLVMTSEETVIQSRVHPVVLEVLKEDFQIHGVQSKKPLISIATKLASVINAQLINMITRVPVTIEERKMEEMIKQAIRVLSIVISDKGKEYLDVIKKDFIDLANKIDSSLYI